MQALVGPAELVLVRHAESLGNVANHRARSNGQDRLELEARDPDITLSSRGGRQARALAQHVRGLPSAARPTLLFSSPYARALETARATRSGRLADVPLDIDERLRERELGVMDGQTSRGIRRLHPEEAQRRDWLGKFYYRPPGGESWCDVLHRIRQFLLQLSLTRLDGERVWVFTHQAVILSFRVAMEGLGEEAILDIDTDTALPNCSITRYVSSSGEAGEPSGWRLAAFGDASHLGDLAPRTHEPPADEERGEADGTEG